MGRVLPILFNIDMVRAILDGRKTVTRRLVKPQPESFGKAYIYKGAICSENGLIKEASYQPGDIMYVRETWGEGYEDGIYIYKADDKIENLPAFKKSSNMIYRPSIHMPKEAARIWLKVTNVRVEQLQEITPEQILKEGANPEAIRHYIKQMPEETAEWIYAAYKVEFQQLWNSTIKKSDLDNYGWDANPWVWVIQFERCEKPKEVL